MLNLEEIFKLLKVKLKYDLIFHWVCFIIQIIVTKQLKVFVEKVKKTHLSFWAYITSMVENHS